ncbi:hypothetical protein LXL04_017655 [Taraxacum kok-saghyz]
MVKMSDNINKQTPNTHFIKLNSIFSIFIFVLIFSSLVSLFSYSHQFLTFDRHYIFLLCNGILFFLIINFKENQSVLSNEINHPQRLAQSAMEPVAAIKKQKQEEINEEGNEIEQNGDGLYVIEDHNGVLNVHDEIVYRKADVLYSVIYEQGTEESAEAEPVAATKEQEQEEINDKYNEIEQNGDGVCVIEDHNGVSNVHDEIVYQKAEIFYSVIDEQVTEELTEAAETKELNKRCAEFITKMRERMKRESSSRNAGVLRTQLDTAMSL